MSGSKSDYGPVVVGGPPRIDFLPTETKMRKENRRQRRSLIALVIMIAAVCALGFVFSTSFAATSQAALDVERAKTSELLSQQVEFGEVRTVQADIDGIRNARLVGSATEVIWSDYLNGLLGGMPTGSIVREVAVDSQSALELTPLPDVPLQRARVASITLVVGVSDLFVADQVMTYLKTVPAFADTRTSAVGLNQDGGYEMDIVLNIDSDAWARRFFVNPPADAATEDEG